MEDIIIKLISNPEDYSELVLLAGIYNEIFVLIILFMIFIVYYVIKNNIWRGRSRNGI